MTTLIDFVLNHWLKLALFFSFYWGFRSSFLFFRDPQAQLDSEKDNKVYVWRKECPCLGKFFIWTYQFNYNFVGALAGWVCLNFVLTKARAGLPSSLHLEAQDYILAVAALLGVTGHLPQVLYGTVGAVENLAAAAIKKIAS